MEKRLLFRYYLLDHKILFLIGYLFYFFSPYIIGYTRAFEGLPGGDLYQLYFDQIPAKKLVLYLIITLSWIPAFYLGHYCVKFIYPYKRSLHRFPASFTSRSTYFAGALLFIVFLLFLYSARGIIGGQYNTSDYINEAGPRGKMSTLLVVYNFFLLYQLLSKQRLSRWLIIGTLLTATFLILNGGRMYVMQTFIILLIYKTSFAEKRWAAPAILFFLVAAFILSSFVGALRQGESLNIGTASYSLLAEPVFTWFSTSTFLSRNEIPMFNIPMNFITSFFNLVPNSILGLRQYVVAPAEMGYDYLSPLGGDSVWTSFVINFGAIGSFIFVFITGFLMNFLRHLSESHRFWAVYYILICSMIPFQLFRDGFFIVNKQLFFNFLVMPVIILAMIRTLGYIQQKQLRLKDRGQATITQHSF